MSKVTFTKAKTVIGDDALTREKLLTIGWNNVLNIGLGILALIYVIYAVSTSMWTESSGLIGIAIVGVIY